MVQVRTSVYGGTVLSAVIFSSLLYACSTGTNNNIELTHHTTNDTVIETTQADTLVFDTLTSTKTNNITQSQSEPPSSNHIVTKKTLSGTWKLININSKSIREAGISRGYPFIVIDTASHSFTGFSGCNSISGKLEAGTSTIHFSDISQTKMFCPGTMESDFLSVLTKVETYAIKGDKLLLSSGREQLTFTHQR